MRTRTDGEPRAARRAVRSARRGGLAAAAVLLLPAVLLALAAGPAAAQTGKVKHVPEAQRLEGDAAINRWQRGAETPSEIGQILETIDTARQSGLASVREVRHIGNVLYDYLYHLRICVVESNTLGIAYDRENSDLLYELFKETNPSAIVRQQLAALRREVEKGRGGDPLPIILDLELLAERFGFLWPLQDPPAMTRAIVQFQRDGKKDKCLEAIGVMEALLALPNLDGPIERSTAAYREGLDLLAAGRRDEARERLKDAASYVSQLNVGTYLAESSWFLAKSADALNRGLGNIALASLRHADTTLRSAEERSWREFKPTVAAVREDTKRILETLNDRDKKVTLTTEMLRSIARRIEDEARIPG